MNRYRRIVLSLTVAAAAIVPPAVALAAAPANDNFADATALDPNFGIVAGTNAEATDQSAEGEPDHASSGFGAAHSVWYRWSPAVDSSNTFDTCGSSFDTRLAIYVGSGSGFGSLSPVAANDDSATKCPGTKASEVSSFFSSGAEYFIAVDTSGPLGSCDSRGPFQLRLNVSSPADQLSCEAPQEPPPTDPPPASDDKMNPATPVQPLRRTVRIPRLIASCGDKTPRGNAHCESGPFEFPQTGAVADFFRRLGDRGIPTLVKDTSAKASTAARTPGQAKALREGGYGGELMNVNLDLVSADGESSEDLVQGRKYPISTDQTVTISYTYFYPAKDRKAISEEREALREQAEREARNNQQPKSRCLPIAAGETNKQILDRFPLDASGFRSYLSMFDALAKLGCQVEIAKYVKGRPSATRSYVTDVVGTDAKRHTISVALAQPGNHDFIFTIRENPAEFASQASRSNIPIGTDGKLTVSKKQQNRFTVQVIERSTGRLVAGIPVTFVGKNGQTVSQNTNGDGETTFVSSLTEERDYRLSAEFREMEGWITIRAENRGDKAFTSMANRRIVRSSKDLYAGNNESELEFAKGLPIVPALLGSGDTKAVTSIPRIQQTQVTTVALSGAQSTGQYNVVSVPTNSSTLVGAAPGLLAIGGGDAAQAARQQRRLGIPNPLEFLGAIIGPLKSAIDSGVSNIKNALSSPNQIAIAATANLIGQAGGNLISDKGLGVISVGGGNLISDKGLGVISVGGGNLIGRVGGNLSSDKGIGVIAGDACGCTPVHGGRIISRDGAG